MRWLHFNSVVLLCVLALALFVSGSLLLLGRSLRYSLVFDWDVEEFGAKERRAQRSAERFLEGVEKQFALQAQRVNGSAGGGSVGGGGGGDLHWPSVLGGKEEGRRFCLGITTTPRQPHNYLLRTFQALFSSLDVQEGRQLYRVLTIVHHHATRHREAERIAPYFHRVLTRTNTPDGQGDIDWKKQEYGDYVRQLNACIEYGAPYVLLLQDDVQAANHFVRKLDRIISEMREHSGATDDSEWAAVKLFYSDYWAGWGWDVIHALVAGCVVFAVACAGLASLALFWVCRERAKCFSVGQRTCLSLVIGVVCGLVLAASLVVLGRQHLWSPFHLGFNEWQGSAACALLFPLHAAKKVAAELQAQSDWSQPVDIAIDAAVERSRKHHHIYMPPLFQHLGVFSSLRYKNRLDLGQRLQHYKYSLWWKPDW